MGLVSGWSLTAPECPRGRRGVEQFVLFVVFISLPAVAIAFSLSRCRCLIALSAVSMLLLAESMSHRAIRGVDFAIGGVEFAVGGADPPISVAQPEVSFSATAAK